jgi:hypothetical protein
MKTQVYGNQLDTQAHMVLTDSILIWKYKCMHSIRLSQAIVITWTATNMNLTNSALATYDIMTDVPTLTDEDTANYAVMNPLDLASTSTVMSDGNLKVSHTGAIWNADRATVGVSSGKWYWEVTVNVVGFTFAGGVMKTELAILNNTFPGNGSYPSGSTFGYYFTGGKYGGGLNNAAYGASYTNGDTIGTALDLDAGTITFYKNGVSQGVAWTGLSGEFAPATGLYSTSNHDVNFGQRPFAYTPPAGYLKLNTFNLPDSSIVDGSENFDSSLYTGTGASQTVTQTGAGFQPDLLWIKARSSALTHNLWDSVRGLNKYIESNTTAAEVVFGGNQVAFNSNGFGVGPLALMSTNGVTYVGWQWKAGGTAVSNTDGTITSSVSANPTAGFSVLTFTGTQTNQTVGHGLGVAPEIIITKPTIVQNWVVGATSIGWTKYLHLNLTNAAGTSASPWNNTAPTSSVYSVGIAPDTNNNGNTMVAYCFASVEGYSKIGSYTGNGNANGPFVYTGFRPAWIMLRDSTNVQNWIVLDTARNTYNAPASYLLPNSSGAEGTLDPGVDVLSNGFKMRTANSGWNTSSAVMIYMAFAENPFKNSLAR